MPLRNKLLDNTVALNSIFSGLLTTEDNVIPANNLLKDQYMVLLWVQKNIHVFGGDSNKVTGVGHSSGAISLDYHILNKKAKG